MGKELKVINIIVINVGVAKPFRFRWSKSLETGTVPEILKTGIISPIHKGRCRGLAGQYRPVVLTSHLQWWAIR